jgi:hypothetical protein
VKFANLQEKFSENLRVQYGLTSPAVDTVIDTVVELANSTCGDIQCNKIKTSLEKLNDAIAANDKQEIKLHMTEISTQLCIAAQMRFNYQEYYLNNSPKNVNDAVSLLVAATALREIASQLIDDDGRKKMYDLATNSIQNDAMACIRCLPLEQQELMLLTFENKKTDQEESEPIFDAGDNPHENSETLSLFDQICRLFALFFGHYCRASSSGQQKENDDIIDEDVQISGKVEESIDDTSTDEQISG